MHPVRLTAAGRKQANTLCVLLAIACWLVVSLVPVSTPAAEHAQHDSHCVVTPADQWLGTDGLRTESIYAKHTVDQDDQGFTTWLSIGEWQPVGNLDRSLLAGRHSATPGPSLLTLGICLRL